MKRPRATVVTLGQFVRSWDDSIYRNSTEKVVVSHWGPILLVLPRHLSGWRAEKK